MAKPDINDKQTIARFCVLALEAGVNAMRHYRQNVQVDSKADKSPVTQADREGEELITQGLAALFPDIQIIGEEAAAETPPETIADTFFLLDALDGTREFINHRSDFTVNIGLIDKTRPVAGVVYAPAKARLFFTFGGAAYEISAPPTPDTAKAFNLDAAHQIKARPVPSDGAVVVASHSHRKPETDAWLENIHVQDIISAGSSLKFCLLATGEADLYPRHGRTMEWDTAAAHAILLAAGGQVADFDGQPLTYGKLARGLDNPFFLATGA